MVLQLVLVWGGAVVLSWYWSGEERVVLQLVVWGGAHGAAAGGLGRSTWCCSWWSGEEHMVLQLMVWGGAHGAVAGYKGGLLCFAT